MKLNLNVDPAAQYTCVRFAHSFELYYAHTVKVTQHLLSLLAAHT